MASTSSGSDEMTEAKSLVPSGTQPLGDLSAGLAVLDRQPHHLRIDEGIIFADDRDFLVVLDVVGVVAEARLPLGAVHVGSDRRSATA